MSVTPPMAVEALVAALLLASGVLSLIGAFGLLRLRTFFQRMHPPALAFTFGTWCAATASAVWFSALEGRLSLQAWIVAVALAVTVPVTTTLLARAALFRMREAGEDVPAARGEPQG